MRFNLGILAFLSGLVVTPALALPPPPPLTPASVFQDLMCKLTPMLPTLFCHPPMKIDIDARDEAVNFGDNKPEDIIGLLLDNCSEVGCSGGKAVTTPTNVIDGNGILQYMQLTMSAEGSFNRGKNSTRETMVEIAKGVARATFTEADVEYYDTCGSPFCGYLSMKQYHFSQSLHMATLEENGDDAFLNIFLSIDFPTNNGFCGKLIGAGASIGGMVNGFVGGVIGLGALVCR
ncbi:hypothetical protein B0H66DRAFT_597584 [Apodospora peruviana]|uniref:Uncharacterized protein n=1 Tax=Apodospora peruviana TaxID=516989 RepID=A0AAE0IS55_9PEZI|nr:hypothetical protein B0H66DRAFT_597584 [Apodospora peruviana]